MSVKSFNVVDLGKVGLLDPTKMGYKDSLEIIKDESFKIQKSFVKIGWYLKHIRDDELYKADGYDNIYDCAADQLGYAQSTVSRFINICEKFSKDHNSPELDEKYAGFDKSQMIEMLPMSPEQLEKVTPDMTVKQIREVNKKEKAVNEPDDGEIRDFCRAHLKRLTDSERENLKEYMTEKYGKTHAGGGPDPDFKCSPRGISINHSDEITWVNFVKRVSVLNELIPMWDKPEQQDTEIPGQTSIEKDFPEYMPENHSVSAEQNDNDQKYATSHNMQQDSCPPKISSCIRQEWGTAPEAQEKGRKECDACWKQYRKRSNELSEEDIVDGKYQEVSETLSAYDLPKTEYSEDSLLSTKGCGHKYDCFSCAQQCNIRQQERYCVDAPLGNPYKCTTMDSIKNMNKEFFKEDCQFLNLDMAERTAGSDEPVPCCKRCQINATCFFCCDKAKELCHSSEKESEEETKALQKSETVVDGECRSISTEVVLENEDEESLREEIEALADGVREVFWGWEGQPIPKGEVEVAKKNAIKLSFAIEKLLSIM